MLREPQAIRIPVGARVFARGRQHVGDVIAKTRTYFQVRHPQLGIYWLHAELILKHDATSVVLTCPIEELHHHRRSQAGEDEELLAFAE